MADGAENETTVTVPATETLPMDSSNLSGSTSTSVPYNEPASVLGTNPTVTAQDYENSNTNPQVLGDLETVQNVNGDDSGNAGR